MIRHPSSLRHFRFPRATCTLMFLLASASSAEDRATWDSIQQMVESYFLDSVPTHQSPARDADQDIIWLLNNAAAKSDALLVVRNNAKAAIAPRMMEELRLLEADKQGTGYRPLEDLKQRVLAYRQSTQTAQTPLNYTFQRAEAAVIGALRTSIPDLDSRLQRDPELRRQVAQKTLALTEEIDPLARARSLSPPGSEFEKWFDRQVIEIRENYIRNRLRHVVAQRASDDVFNLYLVPRNGEHDFLPKGVVRQSLPDQAIGPLSHREIAKLEPVMDDKTGVARYFKREQGERQWQLVRSNFSGAPQYHAIELGYSDVDALALDLRILQVAPLQPHSAIRLAAIRSLVAAAGREMEALEHFKRTVSQLSPDGVLGHIDKIRVSPSSAYEDMPLFASLVAYQNIQVPDRTIRKEILAEQANHPTFREGIDRTKTSHVHGTLKAMERAFNQSWDALWGINRELESVKATQREELREYDRLRERAAGLSPQVEAHSGSSSPGALQLGARNTFHNKNAAGAVSAQASRVSWKALAATGAAAGALVGAAQLGLVPEALLHHFSTALEGARWLIPTVGTAAIPALGLVAANSLRHQKSGSPFRVDKAQGGTPIDYLEIPSLQDLKKATAVTQTPRASEQSVSRVQTLQKQAPTEGHIPIAKPLGHSLKALSIFSNGRVLLPNADYQVVHVPSRDAYFIRLLDPAIQSVDYTAAVSSTPDPNLVPPKQPVPLSNPNAVRELAAEMRQRKMTRLAEAQHRALERGALSTAEQLADVFRGATTYSIFGNHDQAFDLRTDTLEPYERLLDGQGGIHGQCDGANGLGAASLNQLFAKTDPRLVAEVRTGISVASDGFASNILHARTHLYEGERIRSVLDFTSGRFKPTELLQLMFNPWAASDKKRASNADPAAHPTSAPPTMILEAKEQIALHQANEDFERWMKQEGGRLAGEMRARKRDLEKLISTHGLQKGRSDEPLVRIYSAINQLERIVDPAHSTESLYEGVDRVLGEDPERGRTRVDLFLALRAALIEEQTRLERFYANLQSQGVRVSRTHPHYGPNPSTLPAGTPHPVRDTLEPLVGIVKKAEEGALDCAGSLSRLRETRQTLAGSHRP